MYLKNHWCYRAKQKITRTNDACEKLKTINRTIVASVIAEFSLNFSPIDATSPQSLPGDFSHECEHRNQTGRYSTPSVVPEIHHAKCMIWRWMPIFQWSYSCFDNSFVLFSIWLPYESQVKSAPTMRRIAVQFYLKNHWCYGIRQKFART